MIGSKEKIIAILVLFVFTLYINKECHAKKQLCLYDNLGGEWTLTKDKNKIYGSLFYPRSGCEWDVEGGNQSFKFDLNLENGNCCEIGYAQGTVKETAPIRAAGEIATDCGSFFSDIVWEECTPVTGDYQDFGATISVIDSVHEDPAGEDDGWLIDLEQNDCTPEDHTDSYFEAWGDDYAILTIQVTPFDPEAPPGALYIQRYVVEYTPQRFESDLPPIPILDLTAGTTIGKVETTIEESFFILGHGTKTEFVEMVESGLYHPDSTPYLYDLKITFFGQDEFGTDFSFIFHTTVQLDNHDKC